MSATAPPPEAVIPPEELDSIGAAARGYIERLKAANLSSLVVTDSIPLRPDQLLPQTQVLTVAPLLGEAIKRIHRNESVSMLFE